MKIYKRVTIDFGPGAVIVVEVRQYGEAEYQVRLNETFIDCKDNLAAAVELYTAIVGGLIK